MKNLLTYFLLTIVFLSCENSNLEEENFEQLQIDNVLKLSGISQRNAYVLLPSKLKYKIWSDKLTTAKLSLNKNQIAVVNDLLEILEVETFQNDNLNNGEYSSKIESWFVKANKMFNKREFILTFVSLDYTPEVYLSRKGNDNGVTEDSCSCSSSEDYCWFSDCTGSDCNDTYSGCGLLWGKPCNGTCED
jgi:hypothetical protein